jgi:hypothetical protein
MNRIYFFTQMMMLAAAFLMTGLPAWAQGKKERATVAAGVLRLHEVTKRDVPDAPAGQKKQVPVFAQVRWEPIADQAKLVSLNLDLVTLNTDGTQTRISQKYDKLLPLHEMKLPMANGTFAKSFTLNATATILLNGKREILKASKSGNF